MSMNVLAPIFSYLSALSGIVLGCIIGAWFALIFASLRHRSFPVDHAQELLIRPFLYSVPLIVGFLFFRYVFGLSEFNFLKTLADIWDELLIMRTAWFFAGALFGLIGMLLIFVSSILHKAVRVRDGAIFRGGWAAWGPPQ